MTQLKNDIFLRALLKQPVPYTPVWLMRQAGRYLPEYCATRNRAGSFLNLCQNTELATEVTLQPLERFDLDAAILFSDILTVPDAMGLGLYFVEGEGPKFKTTLQSEADINNLHLPDMHTLQYVFDAVASIRKALAGRVPLIGFSGSPFTLACYMVDGGSSKNFAATKTMLYRRPDLLHKILEVTTLAVTEYLNTQILNGAQIIQIFDTWGGILSTQKYEQFSLYYIRQIVQNLIKEHEGRVVPSILFTKGGGLWLEEMTTTGVDALGLDWCCDIGQAKARVGSKVALQGNLDPYVLQAEDTQIEQEVQHVLTRFGSGSGHVFNLGHGIDLSTRPEKVKVLVDAVHHFSRKN